MGDGRANHSEADEHKFDFDLLDPTKIVPEELVPVTIVGRMVLNRNPDNFFAETEQIAFHPGHVVPGIDFTNDPLLQGRLFLILIRNFLDWEVQIFTKFRLTEAFLQRTTTSVTGTCDKKSTKDA